MWSTRSRPSPHSLIRAPLRRSHSSLHPTVDSQSVVRCVVSCLTSLPPRLKQNWRTTRHSLFRPQSTTHRLRPKIEVLHWISSMPRKRDDAATGAGRTFWGQLPVAFILLTFVVTLILATENEAQNQPIPAYNDFTCTWTAVPSSSHGAYPSQSSGRWKSQ